VVVAGVSRPRAAVIGGGATGAAAASGRRRADRGRARRAMDDAALRLLRPRMQHACGGGRAVAELIAAGRLETLDLSALSPTRIAEGRSPVERAAI
jgi:hypothetical protein